MLSRSDTAARTVCASLALAALLSLAAACGTQEEPSPSPTRQVARATPSPAFTVEPATSVPTPALTPVVTPTTTPTPIPQPRWEIRTELSQDKLQVLLEDGLGSAPHVLAADDPERVQQEPWNVAFTVDTDDDGREEAIVLHYTGGAHCCFEYLFFGSESDGIRLLDSLSLGNAGVEDVRDLNGNTVPEVVAADDRLAYFGDLSYAVSPFLPLVLCRSAEGAYYDCTTEFPQLLIDNADVYRGLLEDAVQGQYGEAEEHAAALGLYFSYLRLAMDEEGARAVQSLCPSCPQWLSEFSDEIDERLALEPPWRAPELAACPDDDPAFCAFAAQVEQAIAEKDADFFVTNSRTQSVLCTAEEAGAGYLCRPEQIGETITGVPYGREASEGTLMPPDAYRDSWAQLFAAELPAEVDAEGSGELRIWGLAYQAPPTEGTPRNIVVTYISDMGLGAARQAISLHCEQVNGQWQITSLFEHILALASPRDTSAEWRDWPE